VANDPKLSMLQNLTDQGDKVSLKGILRNGSAAAAASQSLPMDSFSFPEFRVQGRTPQAKPQDEQQAHIVHLEQQIKALQSDVAAAKADALKKAEAAQAKGKADGLAQGLKDGEAKAAKAFQQQVAALQTEVAGTLQTLGTSYDKRIHDVEAQAVELTLGLAKRLWSVEAEIHPERIASIVSEAFSHLGQAENVTLRVHPLDVKYASENQSLWQPINTALKNLRIEGDSRVERGGCWIESEGGGNVDLRSETIIQRLETALREAYLAMAEKP